jgi:hypothetical protein
LKKKKQKTFDILNAHRETSGSKGLKVFWFFFSKKNILLLSAVDATPCALPVCHSLQLLLYKDVAAAGQTCLSRR